MDLSRRLCALSGRRTPLAWGTGGIAPPPVPLFAFCKPKIVLESFLSLSRRLGDKPCLPELVTRRTRTSCRLIPP